MSGSKVIEVGMFESLVQRARAYLEELRAASEKSPEELSCDPIKDLIGYARFLADVGLILLDLDPHQLNVLSKMCEQIERAHACLERIRFQQKHCEQ